jgi:hypothetical protein
MRRSHSPMFAFLLFVIMLAWFYFVTDMGKRTVDELEILWRKDNESKL